MVLVNANRRDIAGCPENSFKCIVTGFERAQHELNSPNAMMTSQRNKIAGHILRVLIGRRLHLK